MTYKETIKVLTKRAMWLEQRIEQNPTRNSHDVKELEALNTALDLLQDFVECDGVPV